MRHFQDVMEEFGKTLLIPSAVRLIIIVYDTCLSSDRVSDGEMIKKVADSLLLDWVSCQHNMSLSYAVETYLTARAERKCR